MDVMPKPPTNNVLDKIVAFDLQGPFPSSKHGGNRYVVGWVVYENGNATWLEDYLTTKDEFPHMLNQFVSDYPEFKHFQFVTDNEVVLNSRKVKGVIRRRKLRQFRHANECFYFYLE